MASIRNFKRTEVPLQLVLVILIAGGLQSENNAIAGFGLLLIGIWQILSCLIHWISIPWNDRSGSRIIYEWALLISVPFGLFLTREIFVLGHFMAIWYFVTCIYETHYRAEATEKN